MSSRHETLHTHEDVTNNLPASKLGGGKFSGDRETGRVTET